MKLSMYHDLQDRVKELIPYYDSSDVLKVRHQSDCEYDDLWYEVRL